MIKNKKSQTAVIAGVLVLALFIFALKISTDLFADMKNKASIKNEDMESDLSRLSFAFSSYGYPVGWGSLPDANDADIKRVGFLNKENIGELDLRKLYRFNHLISSQLDKKDLLIKKNYGFYFSKDDKIVGVNGNCSFGRLGDLRGYNNKRTFYHSATNAFLSPYLNTDYSVRTTLQSYPTNQSILSVTNAYTSYNTLNNSNFPIKYLILDNPRVETSEQKNNINKFLTKAGNISMAGEIIKADNVNTELAGVFISSPTSATPDEFATVIEDDPLLYLNKGDIIIMDKFSLISSVSTATDYKVIAQFSDGKTAIAKWKSETGNIYFFSSFRNMYNLTKHLHSHFIDVQCNSTGLSNLDSAKNVYASTKIVKMPSMDGYESYDMKILTWE